MGSLEFRRKLLCTNYKFEKRLKTGALVSMRFVFDNDKTLKTLDPRDLATILLLLILVKSLGKPSNGDLLSKSCITSLIQTTFCTWLHCNILSFAWREWNNGFPFVPPVHWESVSRRINIPRLIFCFLRPSPNLHQRNRKYVENNTVY